MPEAPRRGPAVQQCSGAEGQRRCGADLDEAPLRVLALEDGAVVVRERARVRVHRGRVWRLLAHLAWRRRASWAAGGRALGRGASSTPPPAPARCTCMLAARASASTSCRRRARSARPSWPSRPRGAWRLKPWEEPPLWSSPRHWPGRWGGVVNQGRGHFASAEAREAAHPRHHVAQRVHVRVARLQQLVDRDALL